MKIILINPPNCGKSIPEERFGIPMIKMIFRGEPLALETLAGNLPEHDVAIIDLKADPEGMASFPFRPDLVGITGVTCEANTMLAIAKDIKRTYGVPVVVGGHHASNDPRFFNHPFIDYIVVGLGKQSFRDLVTHIEKQKPAKIPGVIHNTAGYDNPPFIPRTYDTNDLSGQAWVHPCMYFLLHPQYDRWKIPDSYC